MLRTPTAAGLFLGALFTWGAAPRPKGLGVTDYGSGVKSLGLCPATPNCISTAEAANDLDHYVPGTPSRAPSTPARTASEPTAQRSSKRRGPKPTAMCARMHCMRDVPMPTHACTTV